MAAKVCVGRLMCVCTHVVSTFGFFFHLCEGSLLIDLKSQGLTIYVWGLSNYVASFWI